MSQDHILNKFIKFLENEEKEYLLELDEQFRLFPNQTVRIYKQRNEFLERNKKLKENFTKGYCFGFSLTHAAMDYVGKLDWWEEVLIHIEDWDERPGSLNAEVTLPNTAVTKNNRKPRLKEIITRALNYIVTSQSTETDYFFPDINQLNILKPEGYEAIKPASKTTAQPESKIKRSFFEILDEEEKHDSKIKTIMSRQVMAGNLTKSQLMKDLADDLPEKAVVLVHNEKHTIRIARKGTNWMIYDPNYLHKRATIHKMEGKSNCIDEIFKILTSSISIEVASFDDENTSIHFSEYVNRLKILDASLLAGLGFHQMTRYSPEALLALVKRVDDSSEGKALLLAITQALTEKNSDGWTGLQMMAHYSPDALLALVKRVDDSSEGKALLLAITQALTEKNSDGWTGLQMMARFSPEALLALVKRVDDSSEGKALLLAITQALTEKNSQGWTGLQVMARFSPEALLALVKRVGDSSEGKALLLAITQALTEKKSDGWTGLQMMEHFSPEALLALVKRADDSSEGKALLLAITLALTEKNSDGWTGLQMMAHYSPDALLALVKRVDDSSEGKALLLAITQALTEKNSDGWTGLQMMARFSPAALPVLGIRVICSSNRYTMFASAVTVGIAVIGIAHVAALTPLSTYLAINKSN